MNDEVSTVAVSETKDLVYDNDLIKEEESKLEKAYRLKDEANVKYNAKDYAGAIYLYHRCLLFARSVQQLSQWSLEGLARMERAKQDAKDTESSELTDQVFPQSFEEKSCTSNFPKNQNDEKGDGLHRKRMNSTMRGEEIKREAADLVMKCYNNLAACILNGPPRKEGDYLRAVEYCDKVLMQDQNNEKALFRKGSALAKANQHEQAIAIFKKCNHHEAKVSMAECQHVLDEERRRRDDQIRRNFARNRENERNDDGGQNFVATMNGTAGVAISEEQAPA